MNKWIKPDDLPKGFWKECYIGWTQHGQTEVIDGVKMVRKVELYPSVVHGD
jgi:hypothetical protein